VAEEIGDRAQHLLKVLVESYIRNGQPVGSRALARDSGLEVSAATVRNAMADLEALGMVSSPHTSAGRIPTNKGYRMFVDSLLTIKPLSDREVIAMHGQFGMEGSTQELATSVSSYLSGMTEMAGMVMIPRTARRSSLRHIEFMPLSDNRILAILVINEKDVQNTVIQADRHYSMAELQQAANYLNSELAGCELFDVRHRILKELRETKVGMEQMMQQAITMAEQVFEQPVTSKRDDFVMSGQTKLMGFEALSNVEKLRGLFEAFSEKQQILQLLDQCLDGDGVQIFIGEESGFGVLDECSMVTSAYQVDGEVLGVLGVIGPTRMAYERVIPIVDVTAKLVSAALAQAK